MLVNHVRRHVPGGLRCASHGVWHLHATISTGKNLLCRGADLFTRSRRTETSCSWRGTAAERRVCALPPHGKIHTKFCKPCQLSNRANCQAGRLQQASHLNGHGHAMCLLQSGGLLACTALQVCFLFTDCQWFFHHTPGPYPSYPE